MRLFAASLGTESNTFSPLPTNIQSFRRSTWFGPGEHPTDAARPLTAPLFVARQRQAAEGYTLIEGSCFATEPSGTTAQKAYEQMRDTILEEVRAAMPLDGVLLGLHGAMVAYGYDDVEGDLIARIRDIVGPDCIIGAELDPHCHLTRKRLTAADILVLYKEFPHTDIVERAEDLVTLVLKAVRGEIDPVSSVYDCCQLGAYPTTEPLMRDLVDRIIAREGKDGILSISICICFPYADVAELGVRVLAITDGDKALADRVATEVGEELVSLRGRTSSPYLSIDEAIDVALAETRGPVVMADPADNPGGGAPGDNTTILRRMIERGIEGVALAPIWDPVAVELCFEAGLGAHLPLRFGGKIGPTSGQPIDAMVEVAALATDSWQRFGDTRIPVGKCAAIRFAGIEVVLLAQRTQAKGTGMFTNLGIDLPSRKIILVKSTNHFRAAFAPLAAQVLYVDADGPIPRDYGRIPYTKIDRPLWPLDPDAKGGLIL